MAFFYKYEYTNKSKNIHPSKMVELTFLGITVLAPASEKAPWIPCRERDGYLRNRFQAVPHRKILFAIDTLILYLNLP